MEVLIRLQIKRIIQKIHI